MKVDAKECLEAFQIVDQVDTQPGLLSSQFVYLEGGADELKMSLTGLCTGQASCKIEGGQKWAWWMDRRVLQAFLKSVKTKTITLDLQKDFLLWKSGRQKVTAAGVAPVSGYASWGASTNGATTLTLTPELRKELAIHANYAPTTAAADHLSAVYLCKGYGVISSDSFVVSACLDKSYTTTLPLPVLLTQMLAADNGAASVVIDKDKGGAGVKYKQGYIYQPLSANCISSYPLKKICGVVASQAAEKAVLKVTAKVLMETLTHLRNYIFGSETDLMVICRSTEVPDQTLMTLDVAQGKVETHMSGTFSASFQLKWAIAKIFPWVAYIAGIDAEAEISCAANTDCNIFWAKSKNQRRLLIVSETA